MKTEREDRAEAALAEGGSRGEGDREGLEDVLRDLRKALHRLEKPEKASWPGKILNSAFMVTFLGGIFVAVIGWGLQMITNHHEKEMQEAKQARESKEKVAFDFASSFPVTLDL